MTQDAIVVGVDESRQARSALRWAADTARRSGSQLVGVHVLQWPQARDLYAYSVVADQVYPDPSEVEAMYRTPSEDAFAEIDPEPGWTLRFAQGHAGHILVEESRDARMLVLGAREHTGLMRLLNGSIGHYCLSHAVCPIVSVPLAAPEEQPATGDNSVAAPQA